MIPHNSNSLFVALIAFLACSVSQADVIISSGSMPFYDSLINGNSATVAPGSEPAGLAMNVTFTPNAADIGSASTAVSLLEIGGNVNGTGLYLLGGEVHFLGKMNSAAVNLPGAFNDLTYGDANSMVNVRSTFGALTAGVEYTVAAIYDPFDGTLTPSLDLAIFPSGGSLHTESYVLNGNTGKINWSGNNTITNLIGAGNAGGGTTSASAFNEIDVTANPFQGTIGRGLLWNDGVNASFVAIPEPSSLAFILLGLGGIGGYIQKRKHQLISVNTKAA